MKYKILVALTFMLPISSYLLISALTGQTYDYTINTQNNATVEFLPYDDNYIVFSEQATYTGYLVPYNESYALYIELGDIVKVDKDYFTLYESDGVVDFVNLDDIPPTVEKTNNVVISIASIVALMIVALIVGGKMDVLKSHPRASVMVSLIVVTVIFWGISSIVEDMLNVFVIATITWAVYLVEYTIHQGKITKTEGESANSKLVDALKELL